MNLLWIVEITVHRNSQARRACCRLTTYRCPPGDGLYTECIEIQTGDYQLTVYRCLLPVELSCRAVSS